MPAKALIVYGTRFGATAGTANEIATILNKEGYDVYVVNAKKEKIKDISEYGLIIVGSGIMMGRWTSEPENFLSKFRQELKNKKLAVFISSGGLPILQHEGKIDELETEKNKYLNAKVAKYDLQPVTVAWFGGIWDFNKKPWWSGTAMKAIKIKLDEVDFKESEPGVYDLRNHDAIREWVKNLTIE